MSSILDALRKSERARRLGHAPVYRDGTQPVQTTLLRGLSVAAGVVLLTALGLSVWLLGRPEPSGLAGPATVAEDAAAQPQTLPRTAVVPPEAAALQNAASAGPAEAARSAPSFAEAAGTLRTETTRTRTAKPAPPPPAASGEAPWLSALPDEFRASLPPLMVNIHVYAADESQRILYINNRPLKRGDEIDGVVVEQILPEGVLLRAGGQRFKLPRPS